MFIWECLKFFIFFSWAVLLDTKLSWQSSFQNLECISLPSNFHRFWWEVANLTEDCFCAELLFSCFFSKILSLPLVLNSLMCLGAISLSLSYVELANPFGYVNWCFSYNLGRFLATFSLNIFPSLSLISLFSESLFTVACLMVSHRFPRLHSFFSILKWKITIDLSSSSLILQFAHEPL